MHCSFAIAAGWWWGFLSGFAITCVAAAGLLFFNRSTPDSAVGANDNGPIPPKEQLMMRAFKSWENDQ